MIFANDLKKLFLTSLFNGILIRKFRETSEYGKFLLSSFHRDHSLAQAISHSASVGVKVNFEF